MDLWIDEFGSGGSHVLLVHGAPTPPEHYGRLAGALAEGHHVWLVHLPGYGRSPAPMGGYSLEAVNSWMEAALLRRGVDEVAVVGYSGGGWRSVALLGGRALRVRRAAILASFACLSEEERAGFSTMADVLRSGQDMRHVLPARMLSSAFLEANPELGLVIEGWADAAPLSVIADEMAAFAASADLLPLVRWTEVPLLAMVGTEDVAAPPRHSRQIAAEARAGRLVELEGAGHALLLERYDDVLAELRAFLG